MKPQMLWSLARGRATIARFRTIRPATTRIIAPRIQSVLPNTRSPRLLIPGWPACASDDAAWVAGASIVASLLGTDLGALDSEGVDGLQDLLLYGLRKRGVVERGGQALTIGHRPAEEVDDRR